MRPGTPDELESVLAGLETFSTPPDILEIPPDKLSLVQDVISANGAKELFGRLRLRRPRGLTQESGWICGTLLRGHSHPTERVSPVGARGFGLLVTTSLEVVAQPDQAHIRDRI